VKDWWYSRSRREKLAVAVAAIVVACVSAWVLAWLPMSERQAALQARIAAQQLTLQRLAEARSLLAGHAADRAQWQDSGDVSMASIVEQGLRGAGLAAAIRRIEPLGDGAVSVVLERAAFDPLVGWLQEASRGAGIVVRELSLESASVRGAVNARLQLAPGS
jgi:general secretion pathway protein M